MDVLMDELERSQVLVARAQEGNRAAFDRLVERYRDRLVSVLRASLGDYLRRRVDVDDLLQEVLIRAFSSLSRFQWSEDEAFIRWLRVIARNVVYEVARKQNRELLLAEEDPLDPRQLSPERSVRRLERLERLQAALGRLKPEYREVIQLARIQRLALGEVAERMGRTPNAITLLLRRALHKLKGEFGDTESLHLPDQFLREHEESGDD